MEFTPFLLCRRLAALLLYLYVTCLHIPRGQRGQWRIRHQSRYQHVQHVRGDKFRCLRGKQWSGWCLQCRLYWLTRCAKCGWTKCGLTWRGSRQGKSQQGRSQQGRLYRASCDRTSYGVLLACRVGFVPAIGEGCGSALAC